MSCILVIGDAMIDRYWWGSVTRISPEAPVPIVAIDKEEDRLGAAANVAKNIQAMGGTVLTIFSESFYNDPVVKLRVVSSGRQVVRLDFDKPQKPIDEDAYAKALKDCEVVVISDYGKGALKNISRLSAMARESGATVLVDPKGYRYEKYRGAALVKPNLEEMKVLVGGWESEEELEHKVNVMRNNAEIGAVLLTTSEHGMTLFNGKTFHVTAMTKDPVDVSGAGEAAISAFAVAVADGIDFEEAACFANQAAGIAVQRFGTVVVTRSEVFG
jgi:rfaE bifunctional protein kinase chain/domain